jgi:hypothetical protein
MDVYDVLSEVLGIVGTRVSVAIRSPYADGESRPLATMTGLVERAFQPGMGGVLVRLDCGLVHLDEAGFIEAHHHDESLRVVGQHGIVDLSRDVR